jgi:hypothetical protein
MGGSAKWTRRGSSGDGSDPFDIAPRRTDARRIADIGAGFTPADRAALRDAMHAPADMAG